MIFPIVRMYASAQDARNAYAAVEKCGLSSDLINLVTSETSTFEDGLVAAITKGMVLAADARIYARGVLLGKGLVSVNAPFGTGRAYEDLLDSFNPVDSGIAPDGPTLVWDDAAPFSSAFGFPILSKPSRYAFMGLPSNSRDSQTTSKSLGLPELASSDFSLFGSPKLSRNPAPFSKLLGLKVLR